MIIIQGEVMTKIDKSEIMYVSKVSKVMYFDIPLRKSLKYQHNFP